jgi:hypothetical protein
MKKVVIKIVKGNKEGEREKTAVVGNAAKMEIDKDQNTVDVVNTWISERRQNRSAEKSFSDNKISEWKIMPSY